MELVVFSAEELNSVSQWQAAVDAEGYPLRLSPDVPFETICGFFPMHLRGELTGFECYRGGLEDFVDRSNSIRLDPGWKSALFLVWLGSRENELIAAWMAAAAYARATNGMILDGETGEFNTPDQARKVVYDCEHPSPAMQELKERLNREK